MANQVFEKSKRLPKRVVLFYYYYYVLPAAEYLLGD